MKKRLAIAVAALAVAVAPYGASALQVSAAASGNNTVTTEPVETAAQAGYRKHVENFTNSIEQAEDGTTVEFKKEDNVKTLSADMLKTIAAKKTVSVHMEYTYNGVDYSITIPAGGFQFEEGVWWYGPLWLAAHYAD